MIKKFIFAVFLLLLCSSCVSRTIIKNPDLEGGGASDPNIGKTKLVWFWQDDF